MTRVHKDLFGTGGQDKIHVDEIAVAPGLLLGGAVIVESGSNANGEYVRFGDGTQICWNVDLALTYAATHYLQVYWTFPKAFINSPVCIPAARKYAPVTNARGIDIICYEAPTTTRARIVAHTSAAVAPFTGNDTWDVQAVAIGRWK